MLSKENMDQVARTERNFMAALALIMLMVAIVVLSFALIVG